MSHANPHRHLTHRTRKQIADDLLISPRTGSRKLKAAYHLILSIFVHFCPILSGNVQSIRPNFMIATMGIGVGDYEDT